MRQLRLIAVLALLSGLLGVLAACGSDPTPTPLPTATPIPPTPTPLPPTDTPVASAPGGGSGTTNPGGSPAPAADLALINEAITKTATVDSYHFAGTVNVPGMLAATTIAGDYQSPNKAHLTLGGAGDTREIINIGATSYTKNADGSWTSHDLAAAAGSAAGGLGDLGGLGAMAGNLDLASATNIFGLVSRFVSGVNAANTLGTDTIGGQTVNHYSVPIFLGNLMGTGGSTTPGETPLGYAQVWIDPSTKLVQRLIANIDLTDLIRGFALLGPTVGPDAPTATPFPPVTVNVQIDLTNFGAVPPITAPADVTPEAVPAGAGTATP